MFCFEVWFSAKTASFRHFTESQCTRFFSISAYLHSASLHVIYSSSPLHVCQLESHVEITNLQKLGCARHFLLHSSATKLVSYLRPCMLFSLNHMLKLRMFGTTDFFSDFFCDKASVLRCLHLCQLVVKLFVLPPYLQSVSIVLLNICFFKQH